MKHDEIFHAFEKKEKAKYVAKVKIKDTTKKKNNHRYFYTKAEWLAYLRGQKEHKENTPNSVGSKIEDRVDKLLGNKKAKPNKVSAKKGAETLSKLLKPVSDNKNVSKKSEEIKLKVNKEMDELKEKVSKKIAEKTKDDKKVEKAVEKIINNVTDTITKADKKLDLTKEKITQIVDNGKTIVDEYLNKNEKNALGDNVRTVEEFVSSLLTDGIGAAIFNAIGTATVDFLTKIEQERAEQQAKVREENLREQQERREEYDRQLEENREELIQEALDRGMDIEDIEYALEYDIPLKLDDMSREEDQAATNPNYDGYSREWTFNCAYCTTAYDMRRRGFDVEAAPCDEFYEGTNTDIRSWYVDAPEFKSLSEIAEEEYGVDQNYLSNSQRAQIVEQELLQYGEGASGHFGLFWEGGGGHAVFWEVEHGEVVIRDAQTNETHDVDYYMDYAWEVDYLRTDNLELSERARRTITAG